MDNRHNSNEVREQPLERVISFSKIVTAVVGIFSALLSLAVNMFGSALVHNLIRALGFEWVRIAMAVVVLIAGIGAFVFKRWHQGMYGLVELIFAAITGVSIALNFRQMGAIR